MKGQLGCLKQLWEGVALPEGACGEGGWWGENGGKMRIRKKGSVAGMLTARRGVPLDKAGGDRPVPAGPFRPC